MPLKTLDQRLHYIDHLRGFMFILMAFDHALHAYAQNWGRFWFFWDDQRTVIFDAFYVHNQVIIMPMLFFIFGMFVVPSLQRRGLFSYLWERFFRLGVIYVFGITFLVPLLSYRKYQAGPMWVLHGILGFTLLLLILYYFLPPLYRGLARFFQGCTRRPVLGYMGFGLISTYIFFLSDIIWGAPWWTNFGWIISLQSSRMIMIFIYFLAGSALMHGNFLKDSEFIEKLSDNWSKLAVLYVILAVSFMYYATTQYEITYNEVIMKFVKTNGGWLAVDPQTLWPIFAKYAPPILLRTTLHGFLCLTQALLLLAVFKRFFAKPTALWTSLARNAFGIFILHETIVVWLQYYLNGTNVPIFIKFLMCAMVGISVSWLISAKILLKIPILERIISPKVKEMA